MVAFIAPIALLLGIARAPAVYPLTSTSGIELKGTATLAPAVYQGKWSVVMNEDLDPDSGDRAVIGGADFRNGTIDFDVAGLRTENAPAAARGFVGIAFRGNPDMERYENFYLRMTNGRAPSQELRNHAIQYCSPPDYTWDVLRKKRPGKYEAHTDLELGAWTHVRVWVQGTEAKFYVGNMSNPALVVHELLRGDTHGKVALWVAGYTRAYFSHLTIRAS